MTGFLNNGDNPLSALSIALLADLGYDVDFGPADPFPGISRNCDCNGRRRQLQEEVPSSPEREYAIQWGKKDLLSRSSSGRSDANPNVRYVGDQLVFVLYQEANGDIRGVAVTP